MQKTKYFIIKTKKWTVIQANIFHETNKLFLQKAIMYFLHLQQFQLWEQAWQKL